MLTIRHPVFIVYSKAVTLRFAAQALYLQKKPISRQGACQRKRISNQRAALHRADIIYTHIAYIDTCVIEYNLHSPPNICFTYHRPLHSYRRGPVNRPILPL